MLLRQFRLGNNLPTHIEKIHQIGKDFLLGKASECWGEFLGLWLARLRSKKGPQFIRQYLIKKGFIYCHCDNSSIPMLNHLCNVIRKGNILAFFFSVNYQLQTGTRVLGQIISSIVCVLNSSYRQTDSRSEQYRLNRFLKNENKRQNFKFYQFNWFFKWWVKRSNPWTPYPASS